MLDFGAHIPFVELLGFELHQFADGRSEVQYPTLPEHLNSFHIVHGGASMALMDVAMAAAARSVQPDMGVVTVEMKTSFMRPAKGRLTAKGHLLHRSGEMAFVEASIFDPQGRLCTHGTGTFKYVRRTKVISAGGAPTDAIATD